MRQILLLLVLLFQASSGMCQTKWRTYHHRNGFTIQLPVYFSLGLASGGGDCLQWFENTTNSDIQLVVESIGLVGVANQLKDDFVESQDEFSKITYKVLKPNWYVISGIEDDDIIYIKAFMKDGIKHKMIIWYSESQRALMDTIIPKIAASFK